MVLFHSALGCSLIVNEKWQTVYLCVHTIYTKCLLTRSIHAGTYTAKRRSPPCYLSALIILLSFHSCAIVNSFKYPLLRETSLRCILSAVVCNLLYRRYIRSELRHTCHSVGGVCAEITLSCCSSFGRLCSGAKFSKNSLFQQPLLSTFALCSVAHYGCSISLEKARLECKVQVS